MKEIDEFITYELPNNLLGIIWKGKFRGQKQKWFIFRFEGDETEINVKTGIFGAKMLVNINNDGPVTISMDSR